jgi:hypothetical protein
LHQRRHAGAQRVPTRARAARGVAQNHASGAAAESRARRREDPVGPSARGDGEGSRWRRRVCPCRTGLPQPQHGCRSRRTSSTWLTCPQPHLDPGHPPGSGHGQGSPATASRSRRMATPHDDRPARREAWRAGGPAACCASRRW